MIKEFRAFIERGNLLQIAVAFIMGLTFAAVVTSFVNDIIMPAVGLALGGRDLTSLFAVIKEGDPAGPYNTVAGAKAAGAVILSEPEDGPPARRYRVEDLEGHRWMFMARG